MEHLLFHDYNDEDLRYASDHQVLAHSSPSRSKQDDLVSPLTPWLGFEHDNAPATKHMLDYPAAFGWDSSTLWNGDLRAAYSGLATLEGSEVAWRSAAFIQSWLSLGLLEIVLNKKIQVAYLTKRRSGLSNCLYTRNLHYCLQARLDQLKSVNIFTKVYVLTRVDSALTTLHTWMSRFNAWSVQCFRRSLEASYPGVSELLSQITPAIARLGEVVTHFLRQLVVRWIPTIGVGSWNISYDAVEVQRFRLKENGWCAFQVELFVSSLTQSTRAWMIAANLSQDQRGHEKCTSKLCDRNNVDAKTYEQLHRSPDCSCKPIIPDLQAVKSILMQDQLPVMSLQHTNGKNSLHVSLASRAKKGPYTAFSHVWANGLGGSPEKGLLECQAIYLDKLASSLQSHSSEPAEFWLDSLCIPRSDDKAYIKALIGIRDVYLHASNTIVLDENIQQCPHDAETETMYAHIYCSPWMQRMWTYEEAVLSDSLIFVLKNDHLHHFHVVESLPSIACTVGVVHQDLAAQLYRLRAHGDRLNIGHIQRDFRWRLTNAPQEEFLSISGMLALDTEALMSFKGDERVKNFWIMLKTIPFNAPFINGPKLESCGFRWAPKTFMHYSAEGLDTDSRGLKSKCTIEGLIGRYLFVKLDTVLGGHGGKGCSIFHVVTNSEDAILRQNEHHLGILRVTCVGSWPTGASDSILDAILVASRDRKVPQKGRWLPGVALLQESSKSADGINRYAYVGRVLLERLEPGEVASREQTIMFGGYERQVIHATGKWICEEICIT